MIKYSVYKKRQQDEFNKLPMKAAFGDKQFEEMMASWGLTTSKADIAKIANLGYGAFCLAKDAHLFSEFTEKSLKEDEEYFKVDEQLEDAFLYESVITNAVTLATHTMRWMPSVLRRRKWIRMIACIEYSYKRGTSTLRTTYN